MKIQIQQDDIDKISSELKEIFELIDKELYNERPFKRRHNGVVLEIETDIIKKHLHALEWPLSQLKGLKEIKVKKQT